MFVVILEDRHIDVEVELYNEKEKAYERAMSLAKENCRHPEDLELGKVEGWLLYIRYSCEGDSVRVLEKEPK
jgi:hypothetical protein